MLVSNYQTRATRTSNVWLEPCNARFFSTNSFEPGPSSLHWFLFQNDVYQFHTLFHIQSLTFYCQKNCQLNYPLSLANPVVASSHVCLRQAFLLVFESCILQYYASTCHSFLVNRESISGQYLLSTPVRLKRTIWLFAWSPIISHRMAAFSFGGVGSSGRNSCMALFYMEELQMVNLRQQMGPWKENR